MHRNEKLFAKQRYEIEFFACQMHVISSFSQPVERCNAATASSSYLLLLLSLNNIYCASVAIEADTYFWAFIRFIAMEKVNENKTLTCKFS